MCPVASSISSNRTRYVEHTVAMTTMPAMFFWPENSTLVTNVALPTTPATTAPTLHYPTMIPDHMLVGTEASSLGAWNSPAASIYSDFELPLHGTTPPLSPPLSNISVNYDSDFIMNPEEKSDSHLQVPKRRTQKRPARLSSTTYTPMPSPLPSPGSLPTPTVPASPSSTSELTTGKATKTPAQKMRRLLQNRVSQRNFRQRQASRKVKLEEQVEVLQRKTRLYEDLLVKYETMLMKTSPGEAAAIGFVGPVVMLDPGVSVDVEELEDERQGEKGGEGEIDDAVANAVIAEDLDLADPNCLDGVDDWKQLGLM